MSTLIRSRVSDFDNAVYRSKAGLWLQGLFLPKYQNVIAVLDGPAGRYAFGASNIVTDAGDLHYAQRAVSESLTNAFTVMEMQSAGTPAKGADRSAFTAIGSSEKIFDATYPLRDDADADNTGSGVDIVTFLTSYTKGDFNNGAITHGIITNVTPGASEPLLTGYAFGASINKTANDTLKVFVNHTMNGV